MAEQETTQTLRGLVRDPDAGGKPSSGRAVLLAGFGLVALAWLAIGVGLFVTAVAADPQPVADAADAATRPYFRWAVFSGWYDAGIMLFFGAGGTGVLMKVTGRVGGDGRGR